MKKAPDESYRLSARWNDLFPAELLPRTNHDVSGLQWLHGNLPISINPITMSRWKRSADNTKRSSKPSQHPTRFPNQHTPSFSEQIHHLSCFASLFPSFVKLIEHWTRGTQRLFRLHWPKTHGKGTFACLKPGFSTDHRNSIGHTQYKTHNNWDNIRTPY